MNPNSTAQSPQVIVVKIVKVGPGWLWQLITPEGPKATAVDIQKSPQLALEDAAGVLSPLFGSKFTMMLPHVGGSNKVTENILVWRRS